MRANNPAIHSVREDERSRVFAAMQNTLSADIQQDCMGLLEGMGRYHPQGDCWYLAILGVDHAYQGLGHGARLMKHALALVDAQGLPAYLESSNPMNISLY